MPLTAPEVHALLDRIGVIHTPLADRPDSFLVALEFEDRALDFLVTIQRGGRFLQLTCRLDEGLPPDDGPSAFAVLKEIAHFNAEHQFLKLGVHPSANDMFAFGDVWIEDGTLTREQFGRVLSCFAALTFRGIQRIARTLDSGLTTEQRGDVAPEREPLEDP